MVSCIVEMLVCGTCIMGFTLVQGTIVVLRAQLSFMDFVVASADSFISTMLHKAIMYLLL